MNVSEVGDQMSSLSRTLPLLNHTAVLFYTINDFFKPGSQDVLQSTLPIYELAIVCIALVAVTVVLIYFWKLTYYLVDDTLATPDGISLPYEWRSLDIPTTTRILTAVSDYFEGHFNE